MNRLFKSNTSLTPPDLTGYSVGYPQAGNPGTGTPATRPGPGWYHMITEEILSAVTSAGLTPDVTGAVLTQLRDAIRLLSARSSGALRPVRVVSTAPITLSGTQTIDGVAVVAGDRVLVAGQASAAANGIYIVAAGAWARATDMAADADLVLGLRIPVGAGTVNAKTIWLLSSSGPYTIGTTGLTFVSYLPDAFGGANVNIAAAGYFKLPNGLIIQWTTSGSVAAGGSGNGGWPMTFPTAALFAIGAPLGSTANASAGNVVTGSLTTVGYNLYNWGTIAAPCRVIGIGY